VLEEFHNMRLGVSVARRAWCTTHDLLNTMDVEGLLAWLRNPEERKSQRPAQRAARVQSARGKRAQAAKPSHKKERI
jgi:hypothetical protein